MRTLIKTLSLLFVLGVASPAVHSATFVADFSSSTLDPALNWTFDSGWSATSGSGKVVFESSGAASGFPSGRATFATLLPGDFTAQVTIDLRNSSNVTAQLVFRISEDPTYYTNISGYKPTNQTVGANIGGWDPLTQAFPTNVFGVSAFMTLRMTRVGSVITEFYKEQGATDFTQWHTFEAPYWDGLGGYVYLNARQQQPALIPAMIPFSDFSIEYAVPAPATIALLGFGLVGFRATRRKPVNC